VSFRQSTNRTLPLQIMSRAVLVAVFFSVTFAVAQSSSCAATSCPVGAACVESNGVARCVAPPTSNKCSVAHEEWRDCASCEATCENKQPMCVKMCKPAQCQCRQGFFRRADGQCVTEYACDNTAGRRRRAADVSRTPVALNACAVTECATGLQCVEEAGMAKCVERRGRRSTPQISCANVRCAGPCKDTPTGPQCGPRPLILPIWAGPSSN
ncbi:hypothetical protein PENTCL1PPCAC_15135, partial [Pristionchus entomophagus]